MYVSIYFCIFFKTSVSVFVHVQRCLHIKTNFIRNSYFFNPLNAELNPTCHLLALLGAHPIIHISRIKVNIPTNAHNIYTLKSTKFTLKTLNTCHYMFRSLFKTILRGVVHCAEDGSKKRPKHVEASIKCF